MLEYILKLLSNPIVLVPILICIGYFAIQIKEYKKSTYCKITKGSYFSTLNDKGKWGEYLTYKNLKKYEKDGAKFLFNAYIPKENGETSEIDVLMITKKGIFVLESKNYSGWIFGSEKQRNWCQTLPKGKGNGKSQKEYFYNPIMQNRSHIKHLKALIGEHIPMHSIIVFSERCTLKKIEVNSPDVKVIKRDRVDVTVYGMCKQMEENVLTEDEVLGLFDKIYPYTQNSEEVKQKHIENIRK